MKKQYSVPDRSNRYNYMLDSCVYGTLAEDEEIFNVFKESISKGFRYYTTAIQNMELFEGKGARMYNSECMPIMEKPVPMNKIESFNQINKELNVMLVSEVATFMRDHFRSDGTNRFISRNSMDEKILQKIMSKNNQNSTKPYSYSHDAIIAEAAMHYGCILVTDDKKLRHAVNQLYPGKAIATNQIKEIIRELV